MHQDALKALVLTFVRGAVQQWADSEYGDITPPNLEELITRVFNTCWSHLLQGDLHVKNSYNLEYVIAMKVKQVFGPHLEGYVTDTQSYDISVTTLRKAVNERYGEAYGFSDPLWVDHERVRLGIYCTKEGAETAFGADFYFKTGKIG